MKTKHDREGNGVKQLWSTSTKLPLIKPRHTTFLLGSPERAPGRTSRRYPQLQILGSTLETHRTYRSEMRLAACKEPLKRTGLSSVCKLTIT